MVIKNGRTIPKRGKPRKRTDHLKRNPVGRPTVYKEEYCDIASTFLSVGFTIEQVCEKLDISIETFYNWKERYPPFLEAIRLAPDSLDYACINSMKKKAQGYHEWDDKEIIDELGRTKRVRYKRYYEPDTQILLNHANKRLPHYKEAQESQAKGLFVTEFSKLRALIDPQSTVVSLDMTTHQSKREEHPSEDNEPLEGDA